VPGNRARLLHPRSQGKRARTRQAGLRLHRVDWERHGRQDHLGLGGGSMMRTLRHPIAMFVVAVLVVIGIGVGVLVATGTSDLTNTTAHAITPQSPVQTAYGWFKSVNKKDYSAAVAYFEPTARDMMDWGGGNTSGWPSFSHLHCGLVSETATDAQVQCTFRESQAADEGNPDSFWGIDMHRLGNGPWLIDNYGQG